MDPLFVLSGEKLRPLRDIHIYIKITRKQMTHIKIIIILPLKWSIKVIKFEREHYHFIQFDYLGSIRSFFVLLICRRSGEDFMEWAMEYNDNNNNSSTSKRLVNLLNCLCVSHFQNCSYFQQDNTFSFDFLLWLFSVCVCTSVCCALCVCLYKCSFIYIYLFFFFSCYYSTSSFSIALSFSGKWL